MKNPHDIILRPVLTEKAYDGLADKRYVFEVAIGANKIEIKNAVEEIFGVEVEKVTTITMKRKPRRMGYHYGYTAQWKKAIVKLTADSKTIEFFDGMF